MISLLDFFQRVIKVLEEHEIDYMIVGSVASMIYGEPRLTRDIDIVIELPPNLGPKLTQIFPSSHYYLPPSEIIGQEIINRRQFNLIEVISSLKVDFIVRKTDLHAVAEFGRKRKVSITETLDAFVASPEDVIIRKLKYFKEGQSSKHISDIKGILVHTSVDMKYLQKWVDELGFAAEWKIVCDA